MSRPAPRTDIPPGLTAALGLRVAALVPQDLSGALCDQAERGFIDTFGMILAGAAEPAVEALARGYGLPALPTRARFLAAQGNPELAALINGTAAQALDFDDTGLDGHPSAVLVPSILALAEGARPSGACMIAAYAAGFEVWAELLDREPDPYHGKGLHPTGLFGTVAAAATAAYVLRLNPEQTTHALAISASFASGIVGNFGSAMKPVQTGRAAENGVRAARLAAVGLTAAPDALEHPHGFLRAFSPSGRADAGRAYPADRALVLARRGLNLKLYPVCYAAHRLVDAALALRQAHLINPQDIEAIRLVLGRDQAAPLRERRPATTAAARFSPEFAVSAALLFGRVSLQELQPDVIRSPEIRRMMALCDRVLIDDRDSDEPLFAPADHVEIVLRGGKTLLSPPIRHALGHARNPATDAQLRDKFLISVAPFQDPARSETCYHTLRTLRGMPAWDPEAVA